MRSEPIFTIEGPMSPIEIKRLNVELARVSANRLEMELRIEERLAEIEAIKKNILVQEQREQELRAKLEG